MPEEEETAKYETKVENTDCALNCDIHNGQRYPVDMLKDENLKNTEGTYNTISLYHIF